MTIGKNGTPSGDSALAQGGKWFRWLWRGVLLLVLLASATTVTWVFWPTPGASDYDLLRRAPAGASLVVVQRDLARHWSHLKKTELYGALAESSLLPIRIEADSRTRRTLERVLLDLFGQKTLVAVEPGDHVVLIAPVTPRTKWVWLRACLFQHWKKAGYTIREQTVEGTVVHEIALAQSPDTRIHWVRGGNLFMVAVNGNAQGLAALVRRPAPAGTDSFPGMEASPPGAIQFGVSGNGAVRWNLSRKVGGAYRLELTLSKRRAVRLPWDAARGPRSMALIQRLFPDQGMLTVRGRASHWMTAWDNVIAWLGLRAEWHAESLLAELKYGERLSHGLFPWSGAGDEFACVVTPRTDDTPPSWPTIVGALRCWETNDTQIALSQFLPTLGYALGEEIRLEPSRSSPDTCHVWMGRGAEAGLLFAYRYADGLVIGSNSRQSLPRFDPQRFAGENLEPVPPEDQLSCKPKEIGALLYTLAMMERFAGDPAVARDLNAAASILKAIDELRVTIHVEDAAVKYEVEAHAP